MPERPWENILMIYDHPLAGTLWDLLQGVDEKFGRDEFEILSQWVTYFR